MLSEKEEIEYRILNVLAAAKEPAGSGVIGGELRQGGLGISEATVGRFLRDMDRRELTLRVGFRGRLLTEAGQSRLGELRRERERAFYGTELLNVLRAHGKDELMDVLVARRVIERETARLAAVKATADDIRQLRRIIDKHETNARAGIVGADEDVRFHKLIGQIAGNKVLLAALDLIRQDVQLNTVLESIRKYVSSTVVADHKQIIRAIADGEPEKAETAMVEHIDNVIADVQKYWVNVE
ncbi:MAG: FCD domain-containing protein [bacterium]|jgi:GntR family transcriptional repressor for pyruvate dehydrogenase complex